MAKRNGSTRRETVPLTVQDPPIATQDVVLTTRRLTRWPKDRELPQYHVKSRRVQPCRSPTCRRLLLDNGGQAVVCTSSGHEIAWFRCRACGHRFCLPVKEA